MDSISQRMVGVVLTALLIAGCSNDAGIEGSSKEVTDTSKSAPRQGSGQATQSAPAKDARIILLHHSTGQCIWEGGVKSWFDAYNVANGTKYSIVEKEFPKGEPYGWNNYPYDYWNIWVRHAGAEPYKTEPTLEILTPDYDVIVFKHCFPVSNIEPDMGKGNVAAEEKRLENYKLQYASLKKKLREFPKTRFVVWTGAAQVKNDTDGAQAGRAKTFFDWVKTTWDEPGDNVYVWDFRALETEGGLYLKPAYSSGDGHPNDVFSKKVAPLFAQRIVHVIQGAGDSEDTTAKDEHSTLPVTGDPHTDGTAQGASARLRPGRTGSKAKGPQPTMTLGSDTFVFDNAEDPKRQVLWPKGVAYSVDGEGRLIKINFAEGKEEDWGDYGRQRIVATNPPQEDWDVSGYNYVAFRIRADRDMAVNFTLVTEGDRTDESYFGFTAYLQAKLDKWKWIVLDLTKLELGAEGEKAYAAAGKPTRPISLTRLKLVSHEKNATAAFAIDDIAFYRTLPESLFGKVQPP